VNNFVTEDTSVIKERVAWGSQMLLKRLLTECMKLSLPAPGNLCGEPVESEDTGAHSEENSTEMTAVVPVQTATGT
jgi:hypothetical protein